MFQRWFLEHPQSVGETFFEHQRTALIFSATLLGAGIRCLVHALIPCLFERSASRAIAQLYERMNRRPSREEPLALEVSVKSPQKPTATGR
jgi:hypothetical protein